MKNNKGQLLDIAGAYFIAIVVIVSVIVVVGVYFAVTFLQKFGFLGGGVSVEEKKVVAALPYLVGELYSHQANDRSVFEQAIDMSITKSIETSQTEGLKVFLENLMKELGYKNYRILVKGDDNKVYMEVGKQEHELNSELTGKATVPLLFKDGVLGYMDIFVERSG